MSLVLKMQIQIRYVLIRRAGRNLRFQEIFCSLSGTQSAGDLFEERGVVSFTAAVELRVKTQVVNVSFPHVHISHIRVIQLVYLNVKNTVLHICEYLAADLLPEQLHFIMQCSVL